MAHRRPWWRRHRRTRDREQRHPGVV